MKNKRPAVSRRRFLSATAAGMAASGVLTDRLSAQPSSKSRQATGVKVGEVTDTSALVWMRLTAASARHDAGRSFPRGPVVTLPEGGRTTELQGACPPAAGRLRLRYGASEDLRDAVSTPWEEVTAETDSVRHFRLTDLRPGTVYYYAAESTGTRGTPVHAPLRDRFQTAPAPDDDAAVVFTVLSCCGFKDLDHRDGYHIYPAMQRLRPHFFVHTGDNVYYDNDDFVANTVERARHHWHRMHSLPRHTAFHLTTPGYWQKDDHDTLSDDCWPGLRVAKMLPLTFPEGQAVFRQQVPVGEVPYRTFRWGRHVQIWLTEGRDFRSPNTQADGPDKTIWGREQKEWLLRGLRSSQADYKLLISPTPLVGPDRANKRDNHSNAAFRHEGDEFRRLASDLPGRFLVLCGDRHWQYHSVHPDTGLHEFGSGAASDAHAGGSPGLNRRYHRFHRLGGGFISVTYRPGQGKRRLAVRHHDVRGEVVYEHFIM